MGAKFVRLASQGELGSKKKSSRQRLTNQGTNKDNSIDKKPPLPQRTIEARERVKAKLMGLDIVTIRSKIIQIAKSTNKLASTSDIYFLSMYDVRQVFPFNDVEIYHLFKIFDIGNNVREAKGPDGKFVRSYCNTLLFLSVRSFDLL